jgi:hypothetical protein
MNKPGRLFFLLSMALALALHSCSNSPKHPVELAVADSLLHASRSTDSLLRAVDTTEVKKMIWQLSYDLAYIQFNRKDTLSQEEGVILSSFYLLKKPLSIFLKKHEEIRRFNKTVRSQAENLQHDLLHNSFDEKLSLQNCLTSERHRAEAVSLALASIFPSITQIIQTYRDQVSAIEARVQSLKKEGGKEPPDSSLANEKEDDD